MAQKLETLAAALTNTLGDKVVSLVNRLDEITLTVAASDWLAVARLLRDTAALRFEQCIDISGIANGMAPVLPRSATCCLSAIISACVSGCLPLTTTSRLLTLL